MENFDEKLYEEDEFEEVDSSLDSSKSLSQNEDLVNSEVEQVEENLDLTADVLRNKGITDLEKIKFEDESGAVIERSWDSLSRDELINILSGTTDEEYPRLDKEEVELLNNIRSSGMSVSDYLNTLKPEVTPLPAYDINSLSDEDVYALDLLEKVGSENITDEELEEAVNQAKSNEKLFLKTVEGLRNEYIRLLQDEEMKKLNEASEKQKEAYNNFSNSILHEIRDLNTFGGLQLELSQEDVDSLADFVLTLDDQGQSAFGKALQNPTLFTKAAFWILNEDKIIEELTSQIQDSYKRGYNMAKLDLVNKSKVVFTPSSSQNTEDTFYDDDEW